MNDTSRRKFLAAAGVGTAAGAAAVVGGAASSASAATSSGRRAGEPVVAFVEDPRANKVVLMFGEQEVEVHDRDLAGRILRAARGGR